MVTELRDAGIDVVSDLPSGTHFCYFYETKQDLLEILVPYFKAGLENHEFCLWVVSITELLTIEEAKAALRRALPDLDRYLADDSIELLSHDEWFLKAGAFDPGSVITRFQERLSQALASGYAGMRVNGSTAWLQKKDSREFRAFEQELDRLIADQHMIISCTFPLAMSSAAEILDTARTHQFAVALRNSEWDVVETPALKQAKAEIKRLNTALEQRSVERIRSQATINAELHREISERQRTEESLKVTSELLHTLAASVGSARADEQARLAAVLVQGRQRLKDIVADVPGVVWEAWGEPDAATQRVNFVSDYAESMLGYSVEEWVKTPNFWLSIVHPDDQARAAREAAAIFNSCKPGRLEFRWVARDGRVLDVEVQCKVITDETGNPIGVRGVTLDITERKRAQQQHQWQADMLSQVEDAIIAIDNEHRITYWNQGAERLYDLKSDEMRGRLLEEANSYRWLNAEDESAAYASLAATGSWHGENIQLKKSGEEMYIESVVSVIKDANGAATGLLAVVRDITKRKQTEAKLQRLASRLKALHDSDRAILTAQSPEAILQVTLAGLSSEIVPCQRASVVQFDVAKHEAEVIFVQARGETALGMGAHLPLEEIFGDPADLRQGKVHVVEDVTRHSSSFQAALQKEGILSYINVPLISSGVLIGALNLGSDQVNGFDAEAINTAQEVADALALALQHARLLESEQKARQMAETLQKATTALAATLDIEQVLPKVLDTLTQVVDYDTAVLLLCDEDRLNVAAARGVAIFEQIMGNDLPAQSLLFAQLQHGEQSFMLSSSQLTAWTQPADQVSSLGDSDHWLIVPLHVYGALIGGLIIGKGQGRIYGEQEIEMTQTFAQQAAIAIHNAQTYESVRRQREELRFLTARIAEAEEGERRRLAREFHDQVGQNLTALNYTISALQAELSTELTPMIQRRLDDAQRLVGETGQQIHDLMVELRPVVLDDYGLLAALRWYSEQFSKRTDIFTTIAGDEPIHRLALTLETTLFRIAQEALTNVSKHAQATAVTITLEITASIVRLTVADNGVGFARSGPNWRAQPPGWGLLNMRERAEAIGGHLQVHSSLGQGTQVVVEIPN